MSKRSPNYDYTDAHERVLVGYAVGPGLRVFRDGQELELLEGSTLVLSPGDQVLSQDPINHPLLSERGKKMSKPEEATDATDEESARA